MTFDSMNALLAYIRHSKPISEKKTDTIINALLSYIKTYGPARINDPDYYGLAALFYTVQKQYHKASILLLKYIDPHSSVDLKTLNRALIMAATNNDALMVQLLLQHGAQANTANVFDLTPLMLLARFNNHNMIQLLIKYGATVDWKIWNIRMQDKISLSTVNFIKRTLNNAPIFVDTPLLWTLKKTENNMTIDQLLQYIQRGPQASLVSTIQIKSSHEDFIQQIGALGFAIEEEEVEVEIESESDDEISASDADLEAESDTEENMIDLNKAPQSEEEVLQAILHYLNDKKYNNHVNKTDEHGYSLLFWAVRKGYLSVAKLLLELEEALPNIKSALGEPAIVWAASANNTKMVELLLQYGANINEKNTNNESALTWATRLGNEQMTNLLVIKYNAAPIEDWSEWENQMENYPYALEEHQCYTPSISKTFLEAAFEAQKKEEIYLFNQTLSFTPAAKLTLSIQTDDPDERIPSYVHNTPKNEKKM